MLQSFFYLFPLTIPLVLEFLYLLDQRYSFLILDLLNFLISFFLMSFLTHLFILIKFQLVFILPLIISLIFSHDSCVFQDHSTAKKIGISRHLGNLYFLENVFHTTFLCNNVNYVSIELWNSRMGHPSYFKIK